jgi:SAM-dependent methyltransferase
MVDRRLNYGRDIVVEYLTAIAPFATVLDLGAGEGEDLELARRVFPGTHALAIEGYAPCVERLRSEGVEVHQIDIEHDRLPCDDESVDAIISNQVLEHTKEIFWIFHEVSRVLKIDGHLILGLPNLAALHNRVLLALGRQPTVIQTNSAHVRGFTKSDLLKFLDSAFADGYACLRRRGSNFYPFPPVLAKPLARLLPGMAWGMFLLLQKRRAYGDEFLRFPMENRLETPFFVGHGDRPTAVS